jgi:hypothetical protein
VSRTVPPGSRDFTSRQHLEQYLTQNDEPTGPYVGCGGCPAVGGWLPARYLEPSSVRCSCYFGRGCSTLTERNTKSVLYYVASPTLQKIVG